MQPVGVEFHGIFPNVQVIVGANTLDLHCQISNVISEQMHPDNPNNDRFNCKLHDVGPVQELKDGAFMTTLVFGYTRKKDSPVTKHFVPYYAKNGDPIDPGENYK